MKQPIPPLSRRRFLTAAGAAGAGALLSACGGGDDSSSSGADDTTGSDEATSSTETTAQATDETTSSGGSSAAGTKTKLKVLTVGDPFQFSLEKVAPLYTEMTGVEIEIESLGYDALQSRLVASFVSGAADADVITVDQMWTGQYYDNGWVLPLNDFIKADSSIDLGDFIPQVLHSMNTWRGNVVTLPIAAYGQGVMYRPDVFDSLGLDAPPKSLGDANWNWESYIETCAAIHGQNVGGTDFNGTVVCGAQPVPIVHMASQIPASNGARWFANFPEAPWDFEPAITSDANVQAVNYYKQLYDLSPPEAINYNWFEAGTRFSEGDVGMFYWWTPYFYLVNYSGYMTGDPSPINGNFEVAALPSGAGEQTVSIGGWSLGVPSTAEDPQSAYDFIAWATGAEAQKAMGKVTDFGNAFSDFPRSSSYADPELKEIYPYLDVQLELMQAGNGKIARPPMPVYTSLEAIYGLELNNVLNGKDAAEAMGDTAALWSNVLAGNFLLPYGLESYDDTMASTTELISSLGG